MPDKYERWRDYFYVLIILLIGLKALYPVHGSFDLMLADESHYLEKAVTLSWTGMFCDGFFYFLWLKLLSLFFFDLVLLYSVNYALLVVLNPVLLYLLCRKMNRDRFVSALLAVFFLTGTFNIFTWPFITRFALAIILVMLLLFISMEKAWQKMLVLTGGGLMLVYTRPEFTSIYLPFLMAGLAVTVFRRLKSIKSRQTPAPGQLYLIAILAGLLLFTGLIKNPMAGGRDMMAFGQHYGANLQKRENLKINPWTQWRKVLREKFGTDTSMTRAIANNPGEFLKHVRDNAKQVMPGFFYQMYPYFSGKAPGWVKKLLALFIAALFMVAAVYFFRGKAREHTWFYVICLVLALPVLAAMLTVFPRSHYMLLLFGIVLIGAIRSLPDIPKFPRHDFAIKAGLLILVFLMLPWKASGAIGLFPGEFRQPCSAIRRIEAVKSAAAGFDGGQEIRLLSRLYKNRFNINYFSMYVQNRSQRRFSFIQANGAEITGAFIQANRVNMIYIDKPMKLPPHTVQDWQRIDVPGCKEFILVRIK